MANEKVFPPVIRSYLLRLWQEGSSSQHPWRLVVIDLGTGTRHGFTDFEDLVRFFQEEQKEGTTLLKPVAVDRLLSE